MHCRPLVLEMCVVSKMCGVDGKLQKKKCNKDPGFQNRTVLSAAEY